MIMASPQKENGYTAIANELLEALCSYNFPAKASVPPRLVLFVIRKTYGYHKKTDTISISQFQEGIGEKNRSNLVYWLNYLVQAKILVKEKVSNMQVKYGLNKDYKQWLEPVQVRLLVQTRSWTSASTSTKTSASTRTYKRKKDITKEITTGVASNAGAKAVTYNPKGAEIIKAFSEFNPACSKYYGNKTQRAACDHLIEVHGLEKVLAVVAILPKTNTMQYVPTITTPYALDEKWASLESAMLKKKAEQTSNLSKFKVAFH